MPIQLNHTIVFAKDKHASAEFLSQILGLPPPTSGGMFVVVKCDNGISLDYAEPGIEFTPQHYAFLVGDKDFDGIFARVKERGLTYWADPRGQLEGQINTNDGGRGFYFFDPSGHGMEVITRPYGGGPGLDG